MFERRNKDKSLPYVRWLLGVRELIRTAVQHRIIHETKSRLKGLVHNKGNAGS